MKPYFLSLCNQIPALDQMGYYVIVVAIVTVWIVEKDG